MSKPWYHCLNCDDYNRHQWRYLCSSCLRCAIISASITAFVAATVELVFHLGK